MTEKITGCCEGWGVHVPCRGGRREGTRDLPATHIFKGKKLCDIHYRIATGNLGRDPEPFDPDEE
jgi:hypothetical protein